MVEVRARLCVCVCVCVCVYVCVWCVCVVVLYRCVNARKLVILSVLQKRFGSCRRWVGCGWFCN